jgi:bifunctional ADP-heptose synthase (sugar kinase/adenylyltransferase)
MVGIPIATGYNLVDLRTNEVENFGEDREKARLRVKVLQQQLREQKNQQIQGKKTSVKKRIKPRQKQLHPQLSIDFSNYALITKERLEQAEKIRQALLAAERHRAKKTQRVKQRAW